MKKLKISDFKESKLPNKATLNINGGNCSGIRGAVKYLLHSGSAQFYAVCGRNLQCPGGQLYMHAC